jgi:DNA-binding LytR/AlgR family response regulator
MKFSDALLMLGDYPGLKVHRSWWVAADAVESMQRKEGATGIGINLRAKCSGVEKR